MQVPLRHRLICHFLFVFLGRIWVRRAFFIPFLFNNSFSKTTVSTFGDPMGCGFFINFFSDASAICRGEKAGRPREDDMRRERESCRALPEAQRIKIEIVHHCTTFLTVSPRMLVIKTLKVHVTSVLT